LKDYAKLCLAAAQGWKVFLLADSMITDEYLKLIESAIVSDGVQTPREFDTPRSECIRLQVAAIPTWIDLDPC
jgi:hypothetical protein